MRKVLLITGSSGYIGRNLLNFFKEEYKIISLSRQKPTLKCEWVQILDIQKTNFFEIFELYKPEIIIHCAAIAHKGIPKSKKDISYLSLINVEYTKKLLMASLQFKVKKFIFLSSIGVNKNIGFLPLNEKSLLEPNNLYAESKLTSENLIQKILAKSQTSWTILRLPMVYGLHSPGNLNLLIKFIDLKIPFPLEKKEKYRSFLSINNLISAVELILKNNKSDNKIYLLSDEESISLKDLITYLCKIRKKPINYFFVPSFFYKLLMFLPLIGVKFRVMANKYKIDNSKIKKELNWEPPFEFKNEIYNIYRK